jgi:uncharacterized membrane-anchored protein
LVADGSLGCASPASLFAVALSGLPLFCFSAAVYRVLLFWGGFILPHLPGPTVGDLSGLAVAKCGLDFGRPLASATLADDRAQASCG